MIKRYIDFCAAFAEKMREEIENETGHSSPLPFRFMVVFVSVAIASLLALLQLPIMCAVFLLYGIGTNIYTIPVTLVSVFSSSVFLVNGVKSLKDYVNSKD